MAPNCVWVEFMHEILPYGIPDGRDMDGFGTWKMFQDKKWRLNDRKWNPEWPGFVPEVDNFGPWKMFQIDKTTGNGVPEMEEPETTIPINTL